MELAVYTSVICAISLFVSPDFETVANFGVFYGWSAYTMLPLMLGAAGGIFVGQVTKYAGGVRKGFALVAGILLAAFVENAYYGSELSWRVWTALPMVVVSLYVHSAYPYKAPTKKD